MSSVVDVTAEPVVIDLTVVTPVTSAPGPDTVLTAIPAVLRVGAQFIKERENGPEDIGVLSFGLRVSTPGMAFQPMSGATGPTGPTGTPDPNTLPDALGSIWTTSNIVAIKVEYKKWYEDDDAYVEIESGPDLAILPGGTVTSTRGSQIRRTATLELAGFGALPRQDGGGIISARNRYRIWRGVELPGGGSNLELLGTFMLTRVSPARSSTGVRVTVDFADEFKRVDLDSLPATLGVAQGIKLKQIFRWLLTDLNAWDSQKGLGNVEYAEYDAHGGISTTDITPTFTDPRDGVTALKSPPTWITAGPRAVADPEAFLLEDSDLSGSRLSILDSLTGQEDLEIFTAKNGRITVQRDIMAYDVENWTTDDLLAGGYIAWTFDGGDNGSLLERVPEWNIDDFVNEVSITSGDFVSRDRITSGPLAPRQLGMNLRYQEDVSDQPFGDDLSRLRRYSKRTARDMLGAGRQMQVSGVVLPFLEAGDIVRAPDYDDATVKPYELLVLDEVTIPLDVDSPMSLSVRKLDVNFFPA